MIDRAADARHGRQGRAPRADDDRPAGAHPVPLVFPGGDGASSLFQTTAESTGPRLGRYEDQQRTFLLSRRLVGGEDQRQRVGRRRDF